MYVVSLFSGFSSCFVIDSDGYVVLHSDFITISGTEAPFVENVHITAKVSKIMHCTCWIMYKCTWSLSGHELSIEAALPNVAKIFATMNRFSSLSCQRSPL